MSNRFAPGRDPQCSLQREAPLLLTEIMVTSLQPGNPCSNTKKSVPKAANSWSSEVIPSSVVKRIRNILNALQFPVPSKNGTVTLHSPVNLSFVKRVQKHPLTVFSSASSHSGPGPLGPTERVRQGGTDAHPSNAVKWTRLSGWGKVLRFPRVQEALMREKGGSREAPAWPWPAWAVTSSLATVPLERRQSLAGPGAAPLAPCLAGQSI